jgi:hypothetical protein
MADTTRPCSVVLEGGVTSAVIYASLLARLSKHYAFRQLGGASSGAVAATAAAAAEFARRHGADQPNASFQLLDQFPAKLAELKDGRTTLFRYFQPTPAARPAFDIAMAALDRQSGGIAAMAWGAGLELLRQFGLAALLLALPVALLGWASASWLSSRLHCGLAIDCLLLWGGAWLSILLPSLLGALLVLLLWALRTTFGALRDNHWGLCNGTEQNGAPAGSALTTALHGFFQALAGPLVKGPLTFGDLWWGPRPQDGSARNESGERQIDLQIITSAVSQARPVRLPGSPDNDPLREYFYDPNEWAVLFPPDVMLHLKSHARGAELLHEDGRSLRALPSPQHWPVLMAARFSLSFPVLLSALPMYIAIPRREMLRAGEAATRPPFETRKVYFSDGGITSNCPVHLFDAPLPRYPTFGVNLYKCASAEARPIRRSDIRDPELDASATSDATGWRTPLPFLLSIFSTMFGWRDSLQRRLPGYRERIVHIGVRPEAGGLNLAMPAKTIQILAMLGSDAAELLHRDFSTPRRSGEANAWERHRWTRTRTTLSALHAYLAAFADRLSIEAPMYPPYTRLLRTATPPEHPFQGDMARQQALELAEGVHRLLGVVDSTMPIDAMDRNRPHPSPSLHLSPPW